MMILYKYIMLYIMQHTMNDIVRHLNDKAALLLIVGAVGCFNNDSTNCMLGDLSVYFHY